MIDMNKIEMDTKWVKRFKPTIMEEAINNCVKLFYDVLMI
jgi:hypothetical protein